MDVHLLMHPSRERIYAWVDDGYAMNADVVMYRLLAKDSENCEVLN